MRRHAGYAVAMEVARRPEGPEVNGDLRKTVSRRSLVPSELEPQIFEEHNFRSFHGLAANRENYAPRNTLYFKGGRVMIAFFVNYSTVAFPPHLPTLKRQQFFGAVANSLGKNSYFPLPLDVRRCVAPTGEEVDARQRGVN